MTGEPKLLRLGWPRERVESDYLRLAADLTHSGYGIHAGTPAEQAEAERLVALHLMSDPQWRRPARDGSGTLVAIDASGTVVAALMFVAWAVEGEPPTATLTALAVHPSQRRRGLGLALMGALPRYMQQRIGRAPGFTHGTCSPDAARFYQRAGCTVLQPGEPLPFLDTDLINPDEGYPCHFTRDW